MHADPREPVRPEFGARQIIAAQMGNGFAASFNHHAGAFDGFSACAPATDAGVNHVGMVTASESQPARSAARVGFDPPFGSMRGRCRPCRPHQLGRLTGSPETVLKPVAGFRRDKTDGHLLGADPTGERRVFASAQAGLAGTAIIRSIRFTVSLRPQSTSPSQSAASTCASVHANRTGWPTSPACSQIGKSAIRFCVSPETSISA
ncbi:MAG: hypothetical protein IPO95_10105 [Rhodanobacteraceae bacterium]|nr:hypothetical protein [Rhodanobacteraceae bacterium]